MSCISPFFSCLSLLSVFQFFFMFLIRCSCIFRRRFFFYNLKKNYPILNFCIFYISSYIVMQFFRQKSTFTSTRDGAELYIKELKKSQVKYQFNENAEYQFTNEILLSRINTMMCWEIFENYDFNF